MRTIEDIKQEIRSNFMADDTLTTAYGLDPQKTFDEQFSKVSIETIITYIVAVSIWVFEGMLSRHETEISKAIETKAVCTIPWYHQKCLDFQLGDFLGINPATYNWEYPVIDPSKQIIKFASVRTVNVEGVSKLRIYVSKADKQPLNSSELLAFQTYIQEIGAPGTHFEIISKEAVNISVNLELVRDPLILDFDGRSLATGQDVISSAISNYLDNIIYGGVFNKSKLVDAIQNVSGVKDVILSEVRGDGTAIIGQNYESTGGAFVYDSESSAIRVVV